MLDVLYKKATGYEVTETTKEFALDADGNERLVKEKQSVKYIPPDINAIKAYMEIKDGELYSMSDEELRAERKKLLSELSESEKGDI